MQTDEQRIPFRLHLDALVLALPRYMVQYNDFSVGLRESCLSILRQMDESWKGLLNGVVPLRRSNPRPRSLRAVPHNRQSLRSLPSLSLGRLVAVRRMRYLFGNDYRTRSTCVRCLNDPRLHFCFVCNSQICGCFVRRTACSGCKGQGWWIIGHD